MSKEKRKSKEFPCIETTIDLQLGSRVVRLWIDKKELPKNYDVERDLVKKIEDFYEDLRDINIKDDKENDLIRFIATLPNINAVQIMNKDFDNNYKIGTVAYVVDFVDDVHG